MIEPTALLCSAPNQIDFDRLKPAHFAKVWDEECIAFGASEVELLGTQVIDEVSVLLIFVYIVRDLGSRRLCSSIR